MNRRAKFELSAGGVVYRRKNNKFEILLIKDGYNRWALPKGHVNIKQREPLKKAALREIKEETGLQKLRLKDKLGEIKYTFQLKGKLIYKKVVFFLVKCEERGDKIDFAKKEVLAAKWVAAEKAEDKIEYQNSRNIIKKANLKLMANNE